jgi:hypothetical protein
MNGAIALPCAKTISAPSNAMIIKIGTSQNFFRERRNAKSSLINDKIGFLIEVQEAPAKLQIFWRVERVF